MYRCLYSITLGTKWSYLPLYRTTWEPALQEMWDPQTLLPSELCHTVSPINMSFWQKNLQQIKENQADFKQYLRTKSELTSAAIMQMQRNKAKQIIKVDM